VRSESKENGETDVGIEEIVYKLDPTKLKISSGDFAEGFWELKGSILMQLPSFPATKNTVLDSVDLTDKIESLRTEGTTHPNPIGSLMSAGAGALTGLRFFGIPGAIGGAAAGHILSGNKQELNVHCKLKDGRSFIAMMDPKMLERLHQLGPKHDI